MKIKIDGFNNGNGGISEQKVPLIVGSSEATTTAVG